MTKALENFDPEKYGDVRLLARAVESGWHIPAEAKKSLGKWMCDIVKDPDAPPLHKARCADVLAKLMAQELTRIRLLYDMSCGNKESGDVTIELNFPTKG